MEEEFVEKIVRRISSLRGYIDIYLAKDHLKNDDWVSISEHYSEMKRLKNILSDIDEGSY